MFKFLGWSICSVYSRASASLVPLNCWYECWGKLSWLPKGSTTIMFFCGDSPHGTQQQKDCLHQNHHVTYVRSIALQVAYPIPSIPAPLSWSQPGVRQEKGRSRKNYEISHKLSATSGGPEGLAIQNLPMFQKEVSLYQVAEFLMRV